jgi:hypothetical protein
VRCPAAIQGGIVAKKETRIVQRDPDGGWDIVKPGGKRVSGHERTQSDADGRAGQILRNVGGGERITKGVDGKIRKDTIPPARDPNPPRDKEH